MVPRFPVVLASASPRRRQLLQRICREFEVFAPNLDESSELLPLEDRATELALLKAQSIQGEDALVIGSDTIVCLRADALGKPIDAVEASAMLNRLSGREHVVITGVALVWPTGSHTFCETATVAVRELSGAEIDKYIAGGEPMDKAGAYAIQGGAASFARVTSGDENTVIGLPLDALRKALEAHGLAH